MRTALQRWFWLVIVLPVGALFAAVAELRLPQSAVKFKHCFDDEVSTISASLTRALPQLRVKPRQ